MDQIVYYQEAFVILAGARCKTGFARAVHAFTSAVYGCVLASYPFDVVVYRSIVPTGCAPQRWKALDILVTCAIKIVKPSASLPVFPSFAGSDHTDGKHKENARSVQDFERDLALYVQAAAYLFSGAHDRDRYQTVFRNVYEAIEFSESIWKIAKNKMISHRSRVSLARQRAAISLITCAREEFSRGKKLGFADAELTALAREETDDEIRLRAPYFLTVVGEQAGKRDIRLVEKACIRSHNGIAEITFNGRRSYFRLASRKPMESLTLNFSAFEKLPEKDRAVFFDNKTKKIVITDDELERAVGDMESVVKSSSHPSIHASLYACIVPVGVTRDVFIELLRKLLALRKLDDTGYLMQFSKLIKSDYPDNHALVFKYLVAVDKSVNSNFNDVVLNFDMLVHCLVSLLFVSCYCLCLRSVVVFFLQVSKINPSIQVDKITIPEAVTLYLVKLKGHPLSTSSWVKLDDVLPAAVQPLITAFETSLADGTVLAVPFECPPPPLGAVSAVKMRLDELDAHRKMQDSSTLCARLDSADHAVALDALSGCLHVRNSDDERDKKADSGTTGIVAHLDTDTVQAAARLSSPAPAVLETGASPSPLASSVPVSTLVQSDDYAPSLGSYPSSLSALPGSECVPLNPSRVGVGGDASVLESAPVNDKLTDQLLENRFLMAKRLSSCEQELTQAHTAAQQKNQEHLTALETQRQLFIEADARKDRDHDAAIKLCHSLCDQKVGEIDSLHKSLMDVHLDQVSTLEQRIAMLDADLAQEIASHVQDNESHAHGTIAAETELKKCQVRVQHLQGENLEGVSFLDDACVRACRLPSTCCLDIFSDIPTPTTALSDPEFAETGNVILRAHMLLLKAVEARALARAQRDADAKLFEERKKHQMDADAQIAQERKQHQEETQRLQRLLESAEMKSKEDTTCLVCTERPNDCFLNCGHVFCFKCVTYIKSHGSGSCPSCRAIIVNITRSFGSVGVAPPTTPATSVKAGKGKR
jgi:hypothetical protein